MKQKHQPVLLSEVLEVLNPKIGEAYFDGTAGYGGHAAAILSRIGPSARAVLVDRDREAIKALNERFGDTVETRMGNYSEVLADLYEDGSLFDLMLLDLGVSSPQLDQAERGFSFRMDAPLDMRMDQSGSLTASTIVNTYPEKRLADLIYGYGEERRSRAIAAAIVKARPVQTTLQLAEIVRSVVGSAGDIHPATRTFQAIRIEVNAELSSLEQALPLMVKLLAPGGRIGIISFHSLEDRIVKTFFARESKDCICPPKQPICTCDHTASLKLLTKGAIAGDKHDAINPRARSAKLRAAEKINQNKRRA